MDESRDRFGTTPELTWDTVGPTTADWSPARRGGGDDGGGGGGGGCGGGIASMRVVVAQATLANRPRHWKSSRRRVAALLCSRLALVHLASRPRTCRMRGMVVCYPFEQCTSQVSIPAYRFERPRQTRFTPLTFSGGLSVPADNQHRTTFPAPGHAQRPLTLTRSPHRPRMIVFCWSRGNRSCGIVCRQPVAARRACGQRR